MLKNFRQHDFYERFYAVIARSFIRSVEKNQEIEIVYPPCCFVLFVVNKAGAQGLSGTRLTPDGWRMAN